MFSHWIRAGVAVALWSLPLFAQTMFAGEATAVRVTTALEHGDPMISIMPWRNRCPIVFLGGAVNYPGPVQTAKDGTKVLLLSLWQESRKECYAASDEILPAQKFSLTALLTAMAQADYPSAVEDFLQNDTPIYLSTTAHGWDTGYEWTQLIPVRRSQILDESTTIYGASGRDRSPGLIRILEEAELQPVPVPKEKIQDVPETETWSRSFNAWGKRIQSLRARVTNHPGPTPYVGEDSTSRAAWEAMQIANIEKQLAQRRAGVRERFAGAYDRLSNEAEALAQRFRQKKTAEACQALAEHTDHRRKFRADFAAELATSGGRWMNANLNSGDGDVEALQHYCKREPIKDGKFLTPEDAAQWAGTLAMTYHYE